MLFNSFIFVLFALVFFAGWPHVKRIPMLRYAYIVTFSFVFYAYNTPWWLLLLIGTALVDFLSGLGMEKWPAKKVLLLFASLGANLGLLCYFKYQHFLGGIINSGLSAAHLDFRVPVRTLELPIGISFFTFQSMSYTIAIFRGLMKPTKNILEFYAYISLWPQLVAGPIEKAVDLLPQIRAPKVVRNDDVFDAITLIVRGYFKKTVIADNIAPTVNSVFNNPVVSTSAPLWWLATYLFAVQIYCDFSGYTDIARGFAKLMGFDFMLNFNHPYGAKSIQEFWGRWHISLSTWFRDYVYFPLGGNRKGLGAGIRNMWITMLVSGFWHGAAWTFLIWGGLHAFYLTIERLTKWPEKLGKTPAGKHASAAIVFGLVLIAWVFFRANSLGQSLQIVKAMLIPVHMDFGSVKALGPQMFFMAFVGTMMLLNSYFSWTSRIAARMPSFSNWRPVMVGALAVLCVFWRGPGSSFIYFQF